ncbi:MAG: hypothetical protein JNL42_18400, partial [Anaerolineae bacterium]|nr:hypothetical protein [Anaerolineae bacterium]
RFVKYLSTIEAKLPGYQLSVKGATFREISALSAEGADSREVAYFAAALMGYIHEKADFPSSFLTPFNARVRSLCQAGLYDLAKQLLDKMGYSASELRLDGDAYVFIEKSRKVGPPVTLPTEVPKLIDVILEAKVPKVIKAPH